jgi:hypothetical protein
VIGLAQRAAEVAGLAELGQILSGTEAATRAREDDRTHIRVACPSQRFAKPVVHRTVERIQHVGTIQHDRLDRAVAGDLDLGHGAEPTAP